MSGNSFQKNNTRVTGLEQPGAFKECPSPYGRDYFKKCKQTVALALQMDLQEHTLFELLQHDDSPFREIMYFLCLV